MGQTEIIVFIILSGLVLALFIAGTLLFIKQYRQKKLSYENEKARLGEQHRLELLRTQVEIQEQTMQFIGREIHDSVAQKLTLAAIYTQKLEYENEYPAITPKLESISAVINDSLHELRDLSKTLTDNKMYEARFEDLVAVECDRVNETGICQAELIFTFTGAISITVKSFLFRIIQEFIQNSLKHAEAKLIVIRIENKDEDLMVAAFDDGRGFDCELPGTKGIGLGNMERRARMIGGSIRLTSEIGKGTRLVVQIPKKNLEAK